MQASSDRSGGRAQSSINVTPLVDVCLVLLIIFMVLSPRTVPEVSVQVPGPPHPTNRATVSPPIVGLTKDGGVTLDDRPIERGHLSAELSRILESRTKKVVLADFDDDVPYGRAMEILGVVEQSGADVLGIAKKVDSPTPETLRG